MSLSQKRSNKTTVGADWRRPYLFCPPQRGMAPLRRCREQVCKPDSVLDSHLSRPWVAPWLKPPPRERPGKPYAPSTVLLRIEFTAADRSRPPGELLPRLSTLTAETAAVYLCCTCPEVAFGGRYPLSCPVEPGLSSRTGFPPVPAAVRLTRGIYFTTNAVACQRRKREIVFELSIRCVYNNMSQ